MSLTAKQSQFVEFYTDTTNRKTFGNAQNSAIAAGYSKKAAPTLGYKMVKNGQVRDEIIKRRQEQKVATQKTKEFAIEEARQNYENALDTRMKKYWYDMWVNLQGWLVQKIESKSEVEIKETEQEYIHTRLREELKGLN